MHCRSSQHGISWAGSSCKGWETYWQSQQWLPKGKLDSGWFSIGQDAVISSNLWRKAVQNGQKYTQRKSDSMLGSQIHYSSISLHSQIYHLFKVRTNWKIPAQWQTFKFVNAKKSRHINLQYWNWKNIACFQVYEIKKLMYVQVRLLALRVVVFFLLSS